MSQTDGRKLKHGELTELRKRAVTAVQNGESPVVVARTFGVTRAAVYNWLALYRSGGWGALEASKRGGRRPKLLAKQLEWVYKVVTSGDPRQYAFPYALWTSKMLQKVILKHLGVSLSHASVCRMLNQLGLSAQRPLWRAYQQDPAAVDRWVKEEFPKIRKEAEQLGAEIWFGDEAGVRSDAHSGTTWAPRGKTPIVSTTGARFGLNLISAVSRQGAFRFMCVEGRVNAGVFIKFLARLIHGQESPIFLIVDGHPTHKAKCVRDFVSATEGQLRLYVLPPYSPELNPDEHVWNDLKNNGIGRKVITGPQQMRRDVISYLRFIQKTPDRVRAYFRAPTTIYAA